MRKFKRLTDEARMILLKNGYSPEAWMIFREDKRYLHLIPKDAQAARDVMIYDKEDEEFVTKKGPHK